MHNNCDFSLLILVIVMSVQSVSFNLSPVISNKEREKTPVHAVSQRVIETIRSGSGHKNTDMSRSISALEPLEFENILKEVIEELMKADDPVKAMRGLADIFPLEKLQDVIKMRYPSFEGAVQAARAKVQSAQYYLNTTQDKLQPTLKMRLHALLDAMSSVLESFLSAFGLAEFFKPADSEIHADIKTQKIFMLIHLFTFVSAIVLPFLGATLAAQIVGGWILFIVVLSIVYPHLRSVTHTLPAAENWTKKYLEGKLDVVEGRKNILDALAHTLIASKNVKKHPLLIGRSGVGKTETVKSFVAAIERGDYPELKGKRVFYFNTANLVNNSEMLGGGNKILARIKEKIGKHGEKVILVFDEIHLACEKNEHSDIGNQLKTLLDPGSENFPYVIGMTTEEEYFTHIYTNNKAFARRFKCIGIDNTDADETIQVLRDALLRQNPKILIQKGALEYLLQKVTTLFSQAPQPARAIHILSQCIQKTADMQQSPTTEKIESVRKKIRSKVSEGAMGQGEDLLKTEKDTLSDLEAELRFWEKQWEQEKIKSDRFYSAREKLAAAKTALFQSVLKVSKLTPGSLSASSKKEVSSFLLLSYFLGPALDAWAQKEASAVGILSTIDRHLIDTVIADEIENEKRVQRKIEQGKLLSQNNPKMTLSVGA